MKTSAEEGTVDFQRIDRTGVITLNRPDKLNALTSTMTHRLVEITRQADASDEIRVLVLTGTGRAFCVGSDIRELDSYTSAWSFGERTDYGDVIRALRKPVIAAVNGYAYGGGLELALGCDIRMCAPSASFAAPEIRLGWIGGSGQSALLLRSVGPSNAAQMLLTGEPIDAPTALRWGLVTTVTEAGRLLDHALDLAGRISAQAPLAAISAKRDLWAASSMPLDAAIAWERHLQTACLATADAAEGRTAFKERRPAAFQGR